MYVKPIENNVFALPRRTVANTHTHKQTIQEIGDRLVVDSVELEHDNKDQHAPNGNPKQDKSHKDEHLSASAPVVDTTA